MFDQEDGELNVVMGVLFGIIALVIALVIGLGVHSMGRNDVAAQAMPAVQGADGTFVDVAEVGEPLAKLYFAPGATALPADAGDALGRVVAALAARADARALLSGFHDETGTAEVNAEVAKNRAVGVRSPDRGGGAGRACHDAPPGCRPGRCRCR